jgi:hypothetical protein
MDTGKRLILHDFPFLGTATLWRSITLPWYGKTDAPLLRTGEMDVQTNAPNLGTRDMKRTIEATR